MYNVKRRVLYHVLADFYWFGSRDRFKLWSIITRGDHHLLGSDYRYCKLRHLTSIYYNTQ